MHPVVAKFFANYALLPDWTAFAAAQREVMTDDVAIHSIDRGNETDVVGVDAYVRSVRTWSETFANSADRGFREVDAGAWNAKVRVLGTIRFHTPQDGVVAIPEDRHNWTESFDFRGGRIARALFDMGIPAHEAG